MLIVDPWVAGGMSRQMIRAMIERGGMTVTNPLAPRPERGR